MGLRLYRSFRDTLIFGLVLFLPLVLGCSPQDAGYAIHDFLVAQGYPDGCHCQNSCGIQLANKCSDHVGESRRWVQYQGVSYEILCMCSCFARADRPDECQWNHEKFVEKWQPYAANQN